MVNPMIKPDADYVPTMEFRFWASGPGMASQNVWQLQQLWTSKTEGKDNRWFPVPHIMGGPNA